MIFNIGLKRSNCRCPCRCRWFAVAGDAASTTVLRSEYVHFQNIQLVSPALTQAWLFFLRELLPPRTLSFTWARPPYDAATRASCSQFTFILGSSRFSWNS